MGSHRREIGFSSQKIRYEWVDRAARLCMAGIDEKETSAEILAMLAPILSDSGATRRTSRDKVFSILRRIWISPRPRLVALRDSGISLLQELPRDLHVVVHWGMVMASYPFWADVASEAGRLLRLQETFTAPQVRRRLKEKYGDREIVERATRTVLRSFIDWEVLKETGRKGAYSRGKKVTVEDHRLISWLVEAWLHSSNNGSAPLDAVWDSPSLFPFELKRIPGDLIAKGSKRLELLRCGLDHELVTIGDVGRKR